ncbi:DUF1476 domain-containing protein [Methylovirgula sp. HY1]|uniref:DUF1476 domain-containing protein n=1 Tax=Methylovirgula sp. HY1 TaxID=2822761 RepID=UPI001C5AE306|nr:DUF1476 domain-containing protein [Methylovirgula sp. HY1]QXX74877.1 hypothetical protein MHY1_01694 [Methylovirgula sp. HY1]
MTTFDQREQAYEAKLAHDEELKFKATVRRNKWLGFWAAEKLGMIGEAAADYAADLIATELDEGDGDVIFNKLRGDFDAAHVEITDHQIRREMEELFAKATEEIMTVAAAAKAQGYDHEH